MKLNSKEDPLHVLYFQRSTSLEEMTGSTSSPTVEDEAASFRWRNFCLLCNRIEFGEKFSCHSFPSESGIKKKWADFCNRSVDEIRKRDVLCRRHFADNDYTLSKRSKARLILKPGAIPSIHIHNPYSYKRKKLRCIVCDSTGTDVNYYHRFPKDLNIKKQWLKICDLEEIDAASPHACSKLYICRSHFAETAYDIDEQRRILKSNAIPTLHLGPPGTQVQHDFEEAPTMFSPSCATTSCSNKIPTDICQTSGADSTTALVAVWDENNDSESIRNRSNCTTTDQDPIEENTDQDTIVESKDQDITGKTKDIEFVAVEAPPHYLQTMSELSTAPNIDSATSSISYSTSRTIMKKFRFIGDFSPSDVGTPKKARRFLEIAKKTITEKNTKIRTQGQKIRRLASRVRTLKDVVLDLKNKSIIQDSAAATIMVHIDALICSTQSD